MGYTTPRTWVAAETVDEDHLNEQVRDNTVYLKAAVDTNVTNIATNVTDIAKLDDVSQTEPSRVVGTIYRNTSGKIRIVTISVSFSASGTIAEVFCDANSSPSTRIIVVSTSPDRITPFAITFVVPPNFYYKLFESSATIGIVEWFEWDLH